MRSRTDFEELLRDVEKAQTQKGELLPNGIAVLAVQFALAGAAGSFPSVFGLSSSLVGGVVESRTFGLSVDDAVVEESSKQRAAF